VSEQASVTTEWLSRGDGARVARVVIDNQAKLNILDSRLCAALRDALTTLAGEPELRAVVLTGAGERAFIGGADIREMMGLDPDTARAFISGLHEVCAALLALPVPAIARIRGYCLGGGLEVAAACDMRVADDTGSFGMPEVRVGIPSVIEAALLPRLIGWGKTCELLFTGAMWDANEALATGFLQRLVSAGELDDAVDSWLDGIVASGPQAIRAQKALMRKWAALPLDDAVQAGIEAFAQAYETDEPRKLMSGFLNR
jgi:enoyl-CoA hydratase/carnithine racemase